MQSEQQMREQLAKNLAEYRRIYGLTQAELAERLNYSDKSVSKWERGDGVPDVYVLMQLAELYGITTDDLLSDRTPHKLSVTVTGLRRRKRGLITLLSVGVVWLTAVVVFFFWSLIWPQATVKWMTFLFGVPVSFIVLIVFSGLWSPSVWNALSVSGLIWSVAVCVDVCLKANGSHLIYVVAAVLQVLTVLWQLLRFNAQKSHRK